METIAIWVGIAVAIAVCSATALTMLALSMSLTRERARRRALESYVYGLGARVDILETREGCGGPLSSRRPIPPEPASSSGVRPRATIGAPPEEDTRVMTRTG